MLSAMENNKEKIKQAFAARFRKALKELGYSYNEQKKMERLFGVSGQAVRKWAEGQAMPTSSRMPLVAEILGVRRSWLEDGEEPMYPVVAATSHEAFSMSSKEVELVQEYRKLPPKAQKMVQELLSFLNERE